MPNGVSVVGQYTSESTTYGVFTGIGSAGWPVNQETSPLAGKLFQGNNVAPLAGISYAYSLTFHAGGNVEFYFNERTNQGSPLCYQDDTYNFTNGSFYVQDSRLYLKILQGQHTVTDSCNQAVNRQEPTGPATFNFEWELGIAADWTTRLFLTDTHFPGLDNVILKE